MRNNKIILAVAAIVMCPIMIIAGAMGNKGIAANAGPTASPAAPIQKEESRSARVPGPDLSCSHIFAWEEESSGNGAADGMMAYKCTLCGRIAEYRSGGGGVSAYSYFNDELISQIKDAPTGETLKLNTNIWVSFTQSVMEQIAARRDIDIEITYKLEGVWYVITIPAGADVPTDVPFAGFDGYLAGLYGKNEVESN